MLRNVLIGIEKASNNYAAFAPEYDGCVATGETIEEVKRNMTSALEAHLNAMVEDGEELVDDSTLFCLLSVPVRDRGVEATGETLRKYRQRQGMTQADLAKKWEVTPESISEWERGRRSLPGTIKSLLEVVGRGPWRAMRGMRNRVAHDYFDINLELVWDTVQTALPALLDRLPASPEA